MTENKKWFLAALLPFLAIIPFGIVYYYFSVQFYSFLNERPVAQQMSFPYFVKPGDNGYELWLGDLNGLNEGTYRVLTKLKDQRLNQEKSVVIIPSILPSKSQALANLAENLSTDDFYQQIANKPGVVLVDNFCTQDWPKIKEKTIYQQTTLSPGPYCGSEPEIRDIVDIINQYQVKKAVLIYDTESYKDFIGNFILFLTERGIKYEFVNSRGFEEYAKNP